MSEKVHVLAAEPHLCNSSCGHVAVLLLSTAMLQLFIWRQYDEKLTVLVAVLLVLLHLPCILQLAAAQDQVSSLQARLQQLEQQNQELEARHSSMAAQKRDWMDAMDEQQAAAGKTARLLQGESHPCTVAISQTTLTCASQLSDYEQKTS